MHLDEQDDEDTSTHYPRTLIASDGDQIEAHRADDPDVYGLRDIAQGRTPSSPTTVYAVSGDNASGVMGRVLPNADYKQKSPSQVGRTLLVRAVAEADEYMEVAWDGVVGTHLAGFLARSTRKGAIPLQLADAA